MFDPRQRERNREINRIHNTKMKDRLLVRFEETLVELQGYAEKTQVPANPPLPPVITAGIDPTRLKDTPTRHYAVRRSLILAEETLKELNQYEGRKLSPFHLKKLLEQERSLRTLLTALSDPHVG